MCITLYPLSFTMQNMQKTVTIPETEYETLSQANEAHRSTLVAMTIRIPRWLHQALDEASRRGWTESKNNLITTLIEGWYDEYFAAQEAAGEL